MESKEIYEKIDRLRKNKDWTHHYLSVQAGVSHNTLYTWRMRQTMPSFEVLEALCDALHVPMAQLFCDESSQELTEESKKLLARWAVLGRKQKQLVMELITLLGEQK